MHAPSLQWLHLDASCATTALGGLALGEALRDGAAPLLELVELAHGFRSSPYGEGSPFIPAVMAAQGGSRQKIRMRKLWPSSIPAHRDLARFYGFACNVHAVGLILSNILLQVTPTLRHSMKD